ALPSTSALKCYELQGYPFFGLDDSTQELVTVGYYDNEGRHCTLGKIPKGFGPPLQPRWPPPFERLFPSGGSLDAYMHHIDMIAVARQSARDLQRALHEAHELANPYITQGETHPIFLKATEYPPGDPSWKTMKMAAYLSAGLGGIQDSCEIVRVWGPIGLF